MNKKFRMSAVSLAAALTSGISTARVPDTGCDDCSYTSGPSIPNATPNTLVFDNTPYTLEMSAPGYMPGGNASAHQTTGWYADFVNKYVFGGGNDRGDWKCSSCSVVPTYEGAIEWGAFITTVVNAKLWPSVKDSTGQYIGQWKPGDTIAICNGSATCVILTWKANNGTVGWLPDLTKPNKVVKADKGKYKNTETESMPQKNTDATPVFDSAGDLMLWLVTDIPILNVTSINIKSSSNVTATITVGEMRRVDTDAPLPGDLGGGPPPSIPSPGSGGGGAGGACVHVDSVLPDGRRAGDIKVGDVIQLGDENTQALETRVGVVSYSKSTMASGYRIVTRSGISLLCSDTAPIWTDHGFVRAPDLLGKKVATRVDGKDIVTRFETVEVVSEIGMIEVQHITVGDRAFWAGAEHGAYILHHNKYVPDEE
jgi:hypothetical protein